MRRSGVVSSDATAAEAADALLLAGASAIAAAAGGFFAAAGQRPGVLFGSLTLLLAALGTGSRAFDGRLRQPGRGTKRPRGYRGGDEIPPAAYVAAPAGVAALVVAMAYDEGHRLSPVLAPALKNAQRAGSEARAEVLRRIESMGARFLLDGAIARPLVAAGGPAEGGLLTTEDLEAPDGIDRDALTSRLGTTALVTAPWANDSSVPNADVRLHTLVTMDARDRAVVLSYEETLRGVDVPELDVVLSRAAVPVLRGVSRQAPGSSLPLGVPAAMWIEGGAPLEARGDTEGGPVEAMRYGLRRRMGSRQIEPIDQRRV
jgi:hypothetical protein